MRFDIPTIPWDLVESAKLRLTAAWEGRADTPPFKLFWNPANYRVRLPVTKRLDEPEADLRASLEETTANIKALQAGYCNVPSLLVYFGPATTASAFGGELVIRDDMLHVKPVMHKPEEVYSIAPPDVYTAGLCGKTLERMRFFREATNGMIPIRCNDTQSPFDVASMVWHYEDLLTACYTNPEEVHYLLRIVTDVCKGFLRAQAEAAGHLFAYGWLDLWHHRGVHLADDVAAVVSPVIYKEFIHPYNQEMADEFDGVIYHCCRGYGQNVGQMARTRGFMGLDAGLSFHDPELIRKTFAEGGTWLAYDLNNQEQISKVKSLMKDISMICLPWGTDVDDAIAKVGSIRKELRIA